MKFRNFNFLIILVLFCLVISCNKFFDNEKLITPTSVGKIKIGMTYQDVLNIYKDYKYEMIRDYSFGGLCIKNKNNEDIFRVVSNHPDIMKVSENDNTYKIYSIEVFSSEFKTKEGIYSGMTIEDLLKVYPDIALEKNLEDGTEYFALPNYETSNSFITVNLISNNHNETVGIYDNDKDTTTKFNKNGKIVYIWINNNSVKFASTDITESPKPEISNEGKPEIELVKNGILELDNSVTVGDAFTGYKYFKSQSWESFTDSQNRLIVQFNAEPNFDQLLGVNFMGKIDQKLIDQFKTENKYINLTLNTVFKKWTYQMK